MDEYLEKVAIRPQEPLFQTFRSDKPYRSPNVAPRGAQYDPAPSDRRGNLRAGQTATLSAQPGSPFTWKTAER